MAGTGCCGSPRDRNPGFEAPRQSPRALPAARLPERAERDEIAGRPLPGLLLEFAPCRRQRFLAAFAQALGDRPRAIVLPGPERPTGMHQQHLRPGVPAAEHEKPRAVLDLCHGGSAGARIAPKHADGSVSSPSRSEESAPRGLPAARTGGSRSAYPGRQGERCLCTNPLRQPKLVLCSQKIKIDILNAIYAYYNMVILPTNFVAKCNARGQIRGVTGAKCRHQRMTDTTPSHGTELRERDPP